MNKRNYDLKFINKVKEVIERAKKELPNDRSSFINISLWDDGDYKIILRSGWGSENHEFIYRKSDDTFQHLVKSD